MSSVTVQHEDTPSHSLTAEVIARRKDPSLKRMAYTYGGRFRSTAYMCFQLASKTPKMCV